MFQGHTARWKGCHRARRHGGEEEVTCCRCAIGVAVLRVLGQLRAGVGAGQHHDLRALGGHSLVGTLQGAAAGAEAGTLDALRGRLEVIHFGETWAEGQRGTLRHGGHAGHPKEPAG